MSPNQTSNMVSGEIDVPSIHQDAADAAHRDLWHDPRALRRRALDLCRGCPSTRRDRRGSGSGRSSSAARSSATAASTVVLSKLAASPPAAPMSPARTRRCRSRPKARATASSLRWSANVPERGSHAGVWCIVAWPVVKPSALARIAPITAVAVSSSDAEVGRALRPSRRCSGAWLMCAPTFIPSGIFCEAGEIPPAVSPAPLMLAFMAARGMSSTPSHEEFRGRRAWPGAKLDACSCRPPPTSRRAG